MKLSVTISKFTPPSLPQILFRLRLLDILEKNKDKKLILILGQAAQGKTTLAVSHVQTSKIPSAWVYLDKEDSEPSALFQSIVQSLQYSLKDVDSAHLLSSPIGTMETKAEIPLFRDWARSLFELISSPLQVVLDSLDRLSPEAPAFTFLQVLIEDAPPNIHWIMLSRGVPPLSLEFQHLKIRQQALVLTNEELAFTPDETREFFRKIRKIPFTPDQLKKIYSATEGWVGGLILLSEALSRFPEPSKKNISWRSSPNILKERFFNTLPRRSSLPRPNRSRTSSSNHRSRRSSTQSL